MCPVLVQPKYRGNTGCTGTAYRQFDPVLDRCILGLAHPPDIALFYLMFYQDFVLRIDHLYSAFFSYFKSLVMRSVLFSLLGHQAYIGDAAHGFGIKSTVFLAEVDGFLINLGIGTIRNNRLGILKLVVFVPHLT